ncbi:hypothetical protein [Mycobacteroides chelonae]|uniref:hypothetical protein n=1 Tax=Mycobacteroides chelonae TaxID=1774 RepID=UPI0008AA02B6|nr:hypothetical protein [Mycobacteroides chelonae]OHU30230.1 hypothetical protein BKG78_21345 [Mycobacteroides chelonae]
MSVKELGSIAIGVGCLPFVVLDESGSHDRTFAKLVSEKWWKDKLESGLGLLPSITDLAVEIPDTSGRMPNATDILHQYLDEYDIDYDFGPGAYSFIGFTVTIPRRMQPELVGRIRVNSEHFQVFTFYGHSGPVTFIRSNDQADPSPSAYVVLVREFLIHELARVKAPIAVKTIGPSPFWGDFTLAPSKEIMTDLAVKWSKSAHGYDEIAFAYSQENIDSNAAYGALVRALSEPFSAYYFQVRARHKRYERANVVAQLTDELMAVHARPGLRGWFARTFRSGALARELLLAAITAKQLDVEERGRSNAALHEIESDTGSPRLDLPELDVLCKEEASSGFVDRLTMAQEVASTLEHGRISQYEVLVVSASTILGAAAGAIAALIAG